MPKPEADLADASERELLLWEALAALTDEALARRERELELCRRVAELEAARTPTGIQAPAGWLVAKDAAHAAGISVPSIYRKVHKGEIVGMKVDRFATQMVGMRLVIDPSSLPPRK